MLEKKINIWKENQSKENQFAYRLVSSPTEIKYQKDMVGGIERKIIELSVEVCQSKFFENTSGW